MKVWSYIAKRLIVFILKPASVRLFRIYSEKPR